VKWRRADPAAGTLPFPSRLCSLDWVSEPFRVEGVGEVYGEERNFAPKALPTFVVTDHICGTEQDHREGGLYLPDLPPVTFREDGLPTCCGPIPEPPPPPPPPVGETCGTAEDIEVGETFEGITGEVGTEHWLRVVGITAGNLYSITFDPSASDVVYMRGWKFGTCPPPDETIVADTSIANDGFAFSTIVGTFPTEVLWRFISLVEGEAYSFRLRTGL